MKRVLVTGAGGFIGHHLVRLLVEQGIETVCFLRYTSSASPGLLSRLPLDLKNGIREVYGDIRDSDAVRRAMSGCDTVFHLAALIGIPYSISCPRDVVSVNIGGTLNVLEAARKTDTRLLVTSTSEVYGTATEIPITESHRLRAQSPYAASKTGADQLSLSYHACYGLPLTICRPFNTYGPGQSQRAVIPSIINQALHSDHIELGSLEPRRDFLFARDTAAGFLALARCQESIGKTVQLGTGRDVSIGSLARLILGLMGREDTQILTAQERTRPGTSEVMRLVASSGFMEELTGWKPAYSLEEGLQITINWIRSNSDMYPLRGYET
jgi:nucleoside-diphosphate-sugar epimerase